MARVSERRQKEVWDELQRYAVAGLRCPPDAHIKERGGEIVGGLIRGAVNVLAHRGYIRVELFAHNFRRVTILKGPHAGKATASPTFGSGKPYKVYPPQPEETNDADARRKRTAA